MKKALRILACVCSFLLLASSCGSTSDSAGNGNDKVQSLVSEQHLSNKGLHKISVKENSARKFIENGKTDYKIVYGEGSHEKRAAEFLVKQIFAASGAYMPSVSENEYDKAYAASDKLIVIGVSSLFSEAGLVMPQDDIGITGYYLKTCDNSAFIGVEDSMGCQSGVLAFLRYTFGYEMYAEDTVIFENAGETLPDMEIIEKPDFTFHRDGNGLGVYEPDGMYGMGFQASDWIFIPVGGNQWHNSLDYLPKDKFLSEHSAWYSDSREQLCYTAHGDEAEYAAMVEEVYKVTVENLEKYPERNTITFTIQDGMSGCECGACKECASKYGTESAAAIKMTNIVAEKTLAYFTEKAEKENTAIRDFTILIFAYNYMEQAPVKTEAGKFVAVDDSVKLHPNVGVYIAPLNGTDVDYSRSFYDKNNDATRELIEGWAAITDNIYLWLYDTNFAHFALPFNSWDSVIETYRYAAEINAKHVNNLGTFYSVENPTGFTRLKSYIDSKAMYDVNVNYNDLLDDFFENYYCEASEPMRQFFDELNVWMRELQILYPDDIKGYCYENINKEIYWPKRMLDGWLELIDEAYARIEKYKTSDSEKYETLRTHILAESIFPRFALLSFYQGNYDSETLYEMMIAFKDDIEALGFGWVTEADPFTGRKQYTFSELFKTWGLT